MRRINAAFPAVRIRAVPLALCFVAGYVDVCAFIALFGTFIAQITGTYIIAGASLVTHDSGIVAKLLAIPIFMGGAALATAVARLVHTRRPSPLAIALMIELAALAGFFGFGLWGSPANDPATMVFLMASVCGYAAMGVQSALVRIFYEGAPSTNVMTTASSQIAIDATDVLIARRRSSDVTAARKRLAKRCRMSQDSWSAQWPVRWHGPNCSGGPSFPPS